MLSPEALDAVPMDRLLALDHQLCFALYAASRRVQRSYREPLAEIGLTYPRYLVLLVLWEWERTGMERSTVSALGERLDLELGTLTPLLRRLEQKRLIARKRASEDGRELFVRVTRTGSALKERARRVPVALIAQSPLPITDLIELRLSLKRLHEAVVAGAASASL